MRVLQVISSFGMGGSESVAIEISKRLAKDHEVEVQTLRRTTASEAGIGEERKHILECAGVTWREGSAKSQRSSALTAPTELISNIARTKPDIVHSHTDVPDFCVAAARRVLAFRVARTIHNTKLWHTRPLSAWLTESALNNDLVVSISGATQEAYIQLRHRCGLPSSRYQTLIGNGVSSFAADAYFTRAEGLQRLGADPSRIQVGFIARLEPQKGLDILLDAMRALPSAVASKVQLHILGEGSQKALLKSVADGDRILFYGGKPGARKLLRSFDLIAMPSRFEGMPLMAIETLMAGTPLLLTDAPGLREIVPADWPLKVPVEDPAALAVKLAAFVSGEIATPCLPPGWLDKFDVEVMAQSYIRTYQEYLDALRTRSPSKIFLPAAASSAAQRAEIER